MAIEIAGGRLVDHRGSKVAVRLPLSVALGASTLDESGLSADQVRRLREAAHLGIFPRWWSPAGYIAQVAMLVFWGITTSVVLWGNWRNGTWTVTSILVLALVLWLVVSQFGMVFGRSRLLHSAASLESLLWHACCPACAYSLAQVPVQGDGCRVCPECGAAWRLEPGTVKS